MGGPNLPLAVLGKLPGILLSLLLVFLVSEHGVVAQHGAATELRFSRQPGNSTGGVPFPQQPSIQAFDSQGRLTVLDNSTVCSISIAVTPVRFAAVYTYDSNGNTIYTTPTAKMNNGTANFTGLFISGIGSGYELEVQCNDLGLRVRANPISITLGPAHSLKFIYEPAVRCREAGGSLFLLFLLSSFSVSVSVSLTRAPVPPPPAPPHTIPQTAYGGSTFGTQPRLKLTDRGGNEIVDDSTTTVRVELHSFPPETTNATFTAVEGT